MSDSDDELICVSDNPSKGKWPTEQEIDEITERMVTDHVERGLSASELPLKEVLKRFNNCGYSGNFMNSPEYIRLICKQLRKHQKIAANTLAQVQYYKGNISSIDVATLNPGEWLNDTIMNRYMELITQRYPNFVAISSFYTEAFLSSSNMKGEKLPPMEGKIGLLPLNVNAHWTLAMISVRHKTIVLFDSMGNTYDLGCYEFSKRQIIFLDALYVLNKLRIQLNEIYQVNFTVRQHQKVKSQTNSDDCGPFGK